MSDDSMFPDEDGESPEDTIDEREPIAMLAACVDCMGEGRVAQLDDNGEPVLYKSGKNEGAPKLVKCAACGGAGEAAAE